MRAKKVETIIRQEQIVQAALDLIGQKGVFELSISGVAKRVGLVPSGIYRHFKNKEVLLGATLDLIEKKLLGNINQVRKKTGDSMEQLKLLLMREVDMLIKDQAIPHIIFSESIFTESDIRKARIQIMVINYFREVEKIIKKGQAAGQIRQDIDAFTMVLMFKGLILPCFVLWKIAARNVDFTGHAESSWKLFSDAVAVKDKILEGI